MQVKIRSYNELTTPVTVSIDKQNWAVSFEQGIRYTGWVYGNTPETLKDGTVKICTGSDHYNIYVPEVHPEF